MSSRPTFNFISLKQKFHHLSLETFYKSLTIFALIIFMFYILILYNQPFNQFGHKSASSSDVTDSPANISHIMFVVVGSTGTWKFRRPYIESWWRENITRGNIWLDVAPSQEFLPWPSTSPCFRVNEDMNKLKVYPKLVSPNDVRIYRSILETFKLEDNKNVRWYVMGDDDTVFFVDNLIQVLGKYDHTKYYYIGTNSESIKSNFDFSFEMGFGGGGYALSYSLVEALATRIDECIERYPYFRTSDILSASCSADLGVDLTIEKGIHQIDLRGDISGFLSSHPRSPLLTLHHFDAVDPIFPSKDRSESIKHLMKAANVDQSRLLQQTICYHRQTNWSFSISWGYSAHIYESLFPRSFLKKPLETFQPWINVGPPLYMFNTRSPPYGDPCEAPHQFFLETVRSGDGEEVVTSYTRSSARNLPPCSVNSNHSADAISRIQVFSPATRRKEAGSIECCDVEYVSGNDSANVKLRACMKGEIFVA